MHTDVKVDDATGKSDIILFYNSTIRGVSTVNQPAHFYSVQRKTNRWPPADLMNVPNLSAINAYIAFMHRQNWEKKAVSPRACA